MKDMWKGQEAETPPIAVQPLLGKKSRTPISIMKRHLTIELLVVIVSYGLVIAYFLLAHRGRFAVISGIYILTGLLFCVYFFKKYRLLNSMECMACQVKSNLSKQVSTLEKYVRFYLLAGTAIIPIFLLFLYWFEYAFIPPDKTIFLMPSEKISMLHSLSIVVFWALISIVPAYYLNRWYVNKLYGRHINKLKEMLGQMEDASPDRIL